MRLPALIVAHAPCGCSNAKRPNGEESHCPDAGVIAGLGETALSVVGRGLFRDLTTAAALYVWLARDAVRTLCVGLARVRRAGIVRILLAVLARARRNVLSAVRDGEDVAAVFLNAAHTGELITLGNVDLVDGVGDPLPCLVGGKTVPRRRPTVFAAEHLVRDAFDGGSFCHRRTEHTGAR